MKKYLGCIIFVIAIHCIGCKDEGAAPPAGNKSPILGLNSFESASACSSCHPVQYTEWSGSMHRYASNDPIWMLANNGLQGSTQGTLRDWCWQCHSPVGFLTGNAPSTFQFSELPGIVREGVGCDVCHIMQSPHGTTNQRIKYKMQPGRTKFGPLNDPIPSVAHESAYDQSYGRSESCRECHDLIVNNLPVEVTFTEWQNSPWGAMSVECQDCHMLKYAGPAAVGGPVRQNLHRHDFIGVDIAMTPFPNANEQRAAVDSMLKHSVTLSVDAPAAANLNDSIRVAVQVYNDKTGHNIPSSVFFFRQMWVEVTVSRGATVAYRSGQLDANGDLMDRHSELQPNADRDLMLFGGYLFKNGLESNVFELDSMVNTSLAPFASRTGTYRFRVPSTGQWNVRVRLLFRPFGPYLFRAVGGQQYVPSIPTFEMAVYERVVSVG
jgi:hypothetical protein